MFHSRNIEFHEFFNKNLSFLVFYLVFHNLCLIFLQNQPKSKLKTPASGPLFRHGLESSSFVMSILKSHYNPKIVMMMMTVAHFIDGWFGCQNAHYGATQKAFFSPEKTVRKHEIVCQRAISQRHYLAAELMYVNDPFFF